MENFTVLLVGVGGFCVCVTFLFGLVELAMIRTIRVPRVRTFASIRFGADQYMAVVAPAMGALFSGLFVSLAASFVFQSLNGHGETWNVLVGIFLFVVAAGLLTGTLWSALKNFGDAENMVRDPFTIRAAAEESARAPRGLGMAPELLATKLEAWQRCIFARSLNLTAQATSERLDGALALAVESRTFWRSVLCSLGVYAAALLRFPFQFVWPILGLLTFLVGIVGVAVDPASLGLSASVRFGLVLAALSAGGMLATLCYCTARGNRARMWYKINVVALDDARIAIQNAERAHALVGAEEARVQRIIEMAEAALMQGHSVPVGTGRTLFRLGRYRVSKE